MKIYGETLYQIWLELDTEIGTAIRRGATREEAIAYLNKYQPDRLIFRMEDAVEHVLREYDR